MRNYEQNHMCFKVLLIIMLKLKSFLRFCFVFDGVDCQNLIKPSENNDLFALFELFAPFPWPRGLCFGVINAGILTTL